MTKIQLVHMPFLSVLYPSLGIPVVAAELRAAGIACECRYFNDDFAALVGLETYEKAACGKKMDSRVLEWLFTDDLWPCRDAKRDPTLFEYLEIDQEGSLVQWLYKVKREVVPAFLEKCVEDLHITDQPDIVGFSCLFQTLPSLALGKRIKKAYPNAQLVYGGAGFHGCVGQELFEKCGFIDAACTGEGEGLVAPLFSALLAGAVPENTEGLCIRDRKTGAVTIGEQKMPAPERFLSAPPPDFDDYYTELARTGLAEACKKYDRQMLLPFESSRGCWWHEKSPCKFCGLNGVSEQYRCRDAGRVVQMIRYYQKRYGAKRFQACDNNMSMDYFNTLLPMLKEGFSDGEIEIFYCVKSNLNRRQVRALAEAHVKFAQPGIESLSDHLLDCMNKGVSALQNICFLKCARQYGVFPLWYMLMCMYGEEPEDYREMCELIPLITHLNPPGGSRAYIRCHRYSVYFRESEKYFSEIAPEKWYPLLYPPEFDMERLAYFFDHKWKDGADNQREYAALTDALEWWREPWKETPRVPEFFFGKDADGNILLTDTRYGRTERARLDEAESAVYEQLDDVRSFEDIASAVRNSCTESETRDILERFIRYGFAVKRKDRYLGLALREGYYSWSVDERAGLMQN